MASGRSGFPSNPEEDEMLYNLIPKPEAIAIKPPRYISKMGWKTPPTASTFGPAETSQLNLTNLNGSLESPYETHVYRKSGALFGPAQRTRLIPKDFLKKNNRALLAPESNTSRFAGRRCIHAAKPSIPSKHNRPLQGLVTGKNFVKANAIEIMLSEPIKADKRLPKDYPGYHSSYGKVPEYLDEVKREVALEYEFLEKLRSADKPRPSKEEQLTKLDETERATLLNALKSKWNHIQHRYQGITHHVLLDTIGQVRKKEKLEHDLAQLEADIEILSKQNVLIRTS